MKLILFVVALLGVDLSSASACRAQSETWGGTAGIAAMRGYTASSGMGLPGGDTAPASAARPLGFGDTEAVATVTPAAAPLLRVATRRSGRRNHRPRARLL